MLPYLPGPMLYGDKSLSPCAGVTLSAVSWQNPGSQPCVAPPWRTWA